MRAHVGLEEPEPKRVLGYARVSSSDQQEDLHRQAQDLEAHLGRMHFELKGLRRVLETPGFT